MRWLMYGQCFFDSHNVFFFSCGMLVYKLLTSIVYKRTSDVSSTSFKMFIK